MVPPSTVQGRPSDLCAWGAAHSSRSSECRRPCRAESIIAPSGGVILRRGEGAAGRWCDRLGPRDDL